MHPRVGLHQVAFLEEGTPAFLDHCARIGVQNCTLVTAALLQPGTVAQTRSRLATGGPRVDAVNHPFATFPDLERDTGEAAANLLRAIACAAALDARWLYVLTGGRGSLTWEQAAQKFTSLIDAGRAAAAAAGVTLLVENASPFNADIHIAHTLADLIALADIAGIGMCIELHACWAEADLGRLLRRALPNTGLVQVSDYVLGDRTAPCRAVPGDGAIPLQRIIGDVLDAGYGGVFDIELVGPRIEAEGARAATERAARRVSEILTGLGA